MADKRKWEFKARFRRHAYGWKGSSLASERLREATREIKKVAKKEPIPAADGAVCLMERLWPALQDIDTSSGRLGNAVFSALDELIPILVGAPANIDVRRAWLQRLYEAVLEDGVSYLNRVEESWGEICVFPDLQNEWADFLMPLLRECWSDETPGFAYGADICLSCLLEAGRYSELEELLRMQRKRWWHYDKFWAEALLRMGRTDDAIDFAAALLAQPYDHYGIRDFCERALIAAGRSEEAYHEYGLLLRPGNTYLSCYRSLVKKYPDIDPREILDDLINTSDNVGSWFAAASKAGFPDIARRCASEGVVEPKTLLTAARDSLQDDPSFSYELALRALELLLAGHGYEPSIVEVRKAFDILVESAAGMGLTDWAISGIEDLLNKKPAPREVTFANALRSMLDRYIVEDAEGCGG